MSSAHVSHRRKTLALTYLEGAFWAVMVAIAENFALYFAIRRGLSPHEVALLTTVPVLFGALMNWLMPMIVSNRHLKAGIMLSLGLQVLGLAGLVCAALSTNHFAWTFVALSLYWAGGMGAGPLWVDWVAAWLPQERFGRFYSRRSAFLSFVTLIFFLGTALVVNHFDFRDGFIIVFSVALVARCFSLFLISVQSNPPSIDRGDALVHQKPQKWSWTTLAIVIGFSALFKFVANFGSPFFLPYMIRELHLNVVDVAMVNGMSFLGLALLMGSFGEAMRSFQPITGLQMTMLLAALNCLLWTLVTDIISISFLQFWSGVNWTGFDLSCILIIQSNFPRSARRVLGFQMAMVSLAVIGGSLVGSHLLESGLTSIELFQLSAWARFAVAFAFIAAVFFSKEMRIPLKNFGSFLKTAFVVRLTFLDVGRVIPLLTQRKNLSRETRSNS